MSDFWYLDKFVADISEDEIKSSLFRRRSKDALWDAFNGIVAERMVFDA